ncbi:CHAT domain-containing protein [Fulvivirgaceae bacterium BMA12]|uniref:CHAT domain-containing protein n=1 Tax=Agaribacillus aureus TaxID=3051825 RepID=A0ABT8LGW8_9BACT|nr:CHAT domain-containing protein [Fulvivirgaceae bacterium BMA12]
MFKNYNSFYFLLVSVIFLLAIQPLSAQKKWHKSFLKNDQQYEKGNYKKARESNNLLKLKIERKLGAKDRMMAAAYFKEAKYYAAAGYIKEYRQALDRGLNIAEASFADDAVAYARALLEPIDIYSRNGDFLKAEGLLTKSRELLSSSDNPSTALGHEIDIRAAEINAGQGFYTAALQAFRVLQPILLEQARQKTETYIDAKSKQTKTRKLSSRQRKKLLLRYGDFLNLLGATYLNQGDLVRADSALNQATDWMGKNLSKSETCYSRNLLLKGRMQYERHHYKACIRLFEKANALIVKKRKKNHRDVIAVQEQLLKVYLEQHKKGKYKTLLPQFEKSTRQHYNRKSTHHFVQKLIELHTPLDEDNIASLQKNARKLIGVKSTFPEESERRIEVLNFLYHTALVERNYELGQRYLTDILAIKKELLGEKSPVYHLAKLTLANHLIEFTNELQEANAIYRESFTDVVEKEIVSGHADYVAIINHQAELYEVADSYEQASAALEKALQSTREKFEEDDVRYGMALDRFSNLQLKIGDYKAASTNIDQAIAILKKNKKQEDVIHYAKVLETRAKLLALQGYYDEAKSDIYKSEKLQKKSDLSSGIYTVNTIDELAHLYIKMGKYSETERLLKISLDDKTKLYGQENRKLIGPLTELGRLQFIKGEFTDAEKTVRTALHLAVANYDENATKTTAPRVLLSRIYTEIGDLEKAKEQSLKALAIQQQHFGKSHIHVAKTYTQLAAIKLLLKEDVDDIETMLITAREITVQKLGVDNPLYAEVIQRLAALYIRQDQFQKAYSLLLEANEIWADKIGKRHNLNAAVIGALLGDIYYKQKLYDQARDHYQAARKRYDKIFDKKHPSYVKLLSKLSKVHYMSGNRAQAKNLIEEALVNYNHYIKNYFSALSEKQKHKYWHTIKDDFEYFNTLALQYPDLIGKMYDNALITKSLLLNSSIKIRQRILNSDDEALKMKYAEWVDKKELQASILSMSPEQIESNEIDPASLEEDIELLEKYLSEKSTLFATKKENARINWKDIRHALENDEVAVEMVRFRYFDHILTDSVIYAFLSVKKGVRGTPDYVFLKNGRSLETKYFNFYKNAMRFRLKDRYSYKNFWKPIKNNLGKYSTLYLSPDGVYNQINLETIPTPENSYVIDEADIVVLRNTKELHFRKNQPLEAMPLDNTAFILGNPAFYSSTEAGTRFIAPLPGAEAEVKNLSGVLQEKGYKFDYYLNQDATEKAVKEIKSPRIFHVASHGFFEAEEEGAEESIGLDISWNEASRNPLLRSGVLLANSGEILKQTTSQFNRKDGILTAFEAMNLDLDQTELVVLSACETGLGAVEIGEGVYGLQRAFLQAGAKSLVMSLFKVSDDATQKLMSNFYQKWLDSGDKRASFVAAKKEIRSQYPNPMDWGAFVMVGLGQ